MTALMQGVTRAGDLLLGPVSGQPALALALAAVVFGGLAALLFKLATPQQRLSAARGRLIGRLYEAALYQSDLPTILRVQGRLIQANLRYVSLALPGLAALLIPLMLVLPQLEARFGRRPLLPAETVLVSAVMTPSASRDDLPELFTASGLLVEGGPVHRRDTGELTWRVRALAPGRHDLQLRVGETTVPLSVPVDGAQLTAVTRTLHAGTWRQALYDPGARPLNDGTELRRLTIDMPAREVSILGLRAHWLLSFTVIALATGLALRRPLHIEF
ncbi:MAG: hypothetical protein R6X25_06930 [Candidatus Krumholzibacteriia bacterium]